MILEVSNNDPLILSHNWYQLYGQKRRDVLSQDQIVPAKISVSTNLQPTTHIIRNMNVLPSFLGLEVSKKSLKCTFLSFSIC